MISSMKNKCRGRYREVFGLFFIIIFLTTLVIQYMFYSRELKEYQLDMIDQVSDRSKLEMQVVVDELTSSANTELSIVSSKIEETINAEYGNDIGKLKDQLDRDDFLQLSEIISPIVKDYHFNNVKTDGNTIFVATSKGVISDSAYSYLNIKDSNVDANTYRHWSTLVDDSFNKKSCENAIKKLVDKSSDTIIWQYKPTKNKSIEVYDDITLDDLKEVYLKNGIDALKSFDILVPTYITEDGDIFGQKDISMGVRYDNYKIIVIQRINLYDQMKVNYPSINSFETMKSLKTGYEEIMIKIYTLGITVAIVFIIIMLRVLERFNYIFNSDTKGDGNGKK